MQFKPRFVCRARLCRFFTAAFLSRTKPVPSWSNTTWEAQACAAHRVESTRTTSRRQQPLSAIAVPFGLAPSACWAAVGSLCICRCASSDDAGVSPLARFIVLVGGCWLESPAELDECDCAEPTVTGPEPASLSVLALPVLHGPAMAMPALNVRIAQAARAERFVFICISSSPAALPRRRAGYREENRPNCPMFRCRSGNARKKPPSSRLFRLPGSPQQSQQRAAGARIQLLRIQRSILVGVGRIEALLDHGQIFIER